MKLNFTISGDFDIKDKTYSARISKVETPTGDDITAHFFNFAAESKLALDSEDQIRIAATEYATRFHP